ncbi:unnamed protein product [Gongylonema pulchrum]|uniref:MAPK-interacting and spindle-stabilizing protein-like n=1 Tax=Gongylonema pulchrum TaxID=637853 RepID=A0A183D4V9_9BILA|nr:unnamed protein product [Gongylonema pulchrum]
MGDAPAEGAPPPPPPAPEGGGAPPPEGGAPPAEGGAPAPAPGPPTLNIDPPAANVPAAGGQSVHQLTNPSAARLAFKVRYLLKKYPIPGYFYQFTWIVRDISEKN